MWKGGNARRICRRWLVATVATLRRVDGEFWLLILHIAGRSERV